jgi:hypothetical protein
MIINWLSYIQQRHHLIHSATTRLISNFILSIACPCMDHTSIIIMNDCPGVTDRDVKLGLPISPSLFYSLWSTVTCLA